MLKEYTGLAVSERPEIGVFNNSYPMPNLTQTEIFISHRSSDREVAVALCDLIQSSFRLLSLDIICTSAGPFGLENGASSYHELKRKLTNAKLVIYLLSDAFCKSEDCCYEIAWGFDLSSAFYFHLDGVSSLKKPKCAFSQSMYELNEMGVTRLKIRLSEILNTNVDELIWTAKKEPLLKTIAERENKAGCYKTLENDVALAEDKIANDVRQRLAIGVTLSEGISYSYKRYVNGILTEQINEKGTKSVRSMHIRMLELIYKTDFSRKLLEQKRGYFLDRYENLACWIGAMREVFRYIIQNVGYQGAKQYVDSVMSVWSNPHKFFIYLYAGAESHEEGQQLRSLLLSNDFIPRRIIPEILLDDDFMVDFDKMMIDSSTYGVAAK